MVASKRLKRLKMRIRSDYCKVCDCGINTVEKYFYDNRCEQCERKHHDRIEAWRAGAADEELDRYFGARVS